MYIKIKADRTHNFIVSLKRTFKSTSFNLFVMSILINFLPMSEIFTLSKPNNVILLALIVIIAYVLKNDNDYDYKRYEVIVK